LFARAKRALVGGVNSPVRAFKAVGGHPLFIRRGKGPWLWDADGRRYLDFCLSWGPLILGHARREVLNAAAAALRKGSTFGAPCEDEVRLAEAVRQALPSIERVRFTSSGTEAVMGALRAARAFTRRDRVVKFAGCYHGHADSLLVAAGSGAATLGNPDSAGVPARWAADTIVLPYNDPRALRRAFSERAGEIAVVLVEPIAANMGVVLPRREFLEALKTLPRAHGSLLVLDEVVTGFRVAFGGAQSLYGLRPDLTALGKIIGGGFPVGAFGGRKEVMDLVAPLGPVYQAGTLSGNPVAMAAGLETLRILRREDPYRKLSERTRRLSEGLREAARRHGIAVQVNEETAMFTVFFAGEPVVDYDSAKSSDVKRYARFFRALLARGSYFPPAQFEAALLSTAHTDGLLEDFLRKASSALKAV
jgi:glutamate-1-semialdehyde 2,1-aminomutase